MSGKRKCIISAVFFVPVFLSATVILTSQGSGPAQPKGPGVALARTVHDCWGFSTTRINPDRYVLTSMKSYQSPPLLYDIYDNKFIPFPPIETIPGIPVAQELPSGKDSQYRKSELILAGEYWRWQHTSLVYYDPNRGKAGLLLRKRSIRKNIAGSPSCPLCQGPTSLVPKYHRYLCSSCRKYVPESNYTVESTDTYYADMDLATGRVVAMHELVHPGLNADDQEGIEAIGVVPSGKDFYYSNRVFFYKKERSSGHIMLYRLNIPSGSVDLTMEILAPVRRKAEAPATYSIRSHPSADFSHIVFWEYDEAVDRPPAKGYLTSPPAQAWIVDTAAREYFTAGSPLTAYGQAFDRDGKYLVLGSNQTGYIHRYDLMSKKEDMKVRGGATMYAMVLSSGSKYLYVFTKHSVEIRAWPSLKAVSQVPLQKIIPGVTVLLSAEQTFATNDGRYALIGVLKKSNNGPWWSSDRQDGFNLLVLGD